MGHRQEMGTKMQEVDSYYQAKMPMARSCYTQRIFMHTLVRRTHYTYQYISVCVEEGNTKFKSPARPHPYSFCKYISILKLWIAGCLSLLDYYSGTLASQKNVHSTMYGSYTNIAISEINHVFI